MEVHKHDNLSEHKRLKFLVWKPKNNEYYPAIIDIFPPGKEHIQIYESVKAIRGQLLMAGHLFKNPDDNSWLPSLGSESLERAQRLVDGKNGPLSDIAAWLDEWVKPEINKTLK